MPGWHQNIVLEAPGRHLQHLGRYLEALGQYREALGGQGRWPGGSEFKGTGSVGGKLTIRGVLQIPVQSATGHQAEGLQIEASNLTDM